MRNKKPDFFIVGAPKSGTTSMNYYLKQHPDIYMPQKKDVHFFGSDLTKKKHVTILLDEDLYLKQYENRTTEKRAGEASVMYLYSKNAPQEIYAFNPESQIIIMLRDPVDTIYAAYTHNYWGAYDNARSFRRALEMEPQRKKGIGIPKSCLINETLFYHDLGKYYKNVKRYIEQFGREKVHCIIFDEFAANTLKSYQALCAFLGVDTQFVPHIKVVNRSRMVRFWSLSALLQVPPKPLQMFLHLLPERLSLFLINALARFNSNYQPRKPLEQSLRVELKKFYRSDIKNLAKLIDKDLHLWL